MTWCTWGNVCIMFNDLHECHVLYGKHKIVEFLMVTLFVFRCCNNVHSNMMIVYYADIAIPIIQKCIYCGNNTPPLNVICATVTTHSDK